MATSNPAFRGPAFSEQAGAVAVAQNVSAQQLDEIYNRPSADNTDVMTVEDTIAKSFATFVLLGIGAVIGWVTLPVAPWLWIVAGIVGFVLALVNIFKKQPSAPLILAYSAAQGVFIGGISGFYEQEFPGVVLQAVIATFVVVGVTLALFASGKIRASKKATKVFLIAMVGYLVFSVVNIFIMIFAPQLGAFGARSVEIIPGVPIGAILGVLVVIMAAYSLVLDFDMIQRGVKNKAPRQYGWSGAFGIIVTVIWLYLELLRLFAILRN